MRLFSRVIAAKVLTVLYLLMVLSPLATVALRSPLIAHALTGECVADCAICGCSPERSANRTCCCWQKKHRYETDDVTDLPECCKKIHAAQNGAVTISSRQCDSNKNLALSGAAQSDLLPYRFYQADIAIIETAGVASIPVCLSDWQGEPPDPPPRLIYVS